MVEFLVEKLSDEENKSRPIILRYFAEASEDFFVSPKMRYMLGEVLMLCMKSQDYKIRALTLRAILMLGYLVPQFGDRKFFWTQVHQSDEWTVHKLFEDFMDLDLKYVFHDDSDSAEMSKLLDKFGEELNQMIFQSVQEIANEGSLKVIDERNVRVRGWQIQDMLVFMLCAKEWVPRYSNVLDLIDFLDHQISARNLFSLALYKAGR